jgi:hypothetical protein
MLEQKETNAGTAIYCYFGQIFWKLEENERNTRKEYIKAANIMVVGGVVGCRK